MNQVDPILIQKGPLFITLALMYMVRNHEPITEETFDVKF